MKNLKKLLLCIIISVLATNFIVMGITITYVFNDNFMVQVGLNNMFSKNKVEDEQIIEYYREQERLMNEVKESNPGKYRENYPIYGMFSTALPLVKMKPILSMYILSIITGLVLGIVIYLIFVENKKGLEAIISFVVCFLITVLLYYGLQMISNIIASEILYMQFEPFEWYQLFIGYAVVFAGLYLVNLIYQKRVAKKLNKELNK